MAWSTNLINKFGGVEMLQDLFSKYVTGRRKYCLETNIPPSLIYQWIGQHRRSKAPKDNIKWLMEHHHLKKKEAYEISEILYNSFGYGPRGELGVRMPAYNEEAPTPSEEPVESKKKPGGQKKELSPGVIEHFHRKYRESKEKHDFDPNWEPTPAMVSEWLQDGKTSKKVRDRWALELLEKHKVEGN